MRSRCSSRAWLSVDSLPASAVFMMSRYEDNFCFLSRLFFVLLGVGSSVDDATPASVQVFIAIGRDASLTCITGHSVFAMGTGPVVGVSIDGLYWYPSKKNIGLSSL